MTSPTGSRPLSRRTVMKGAAAAALSAAALPRGVSAFYTDLGYIDAHSHLWSPDRNLYPLRPGQKEENVKPTGFTPGEFFATARPEGVNRVVVIGHTGHFGYDASYLVDLLRARPGEIAVQAFLDHTDPAAPQRMRELKAQGVKAFRLRLLDPWTTWFAADDPIVAVWQTAREERLAICPLTNPDWLPQLDRLMEDFPGTTLVVDHFARIGVENFGKVPAVPGPIRDADVAALVKLARHPEAYVKLSAYYALGARSAPYDDMHPMIHALIKAYGPERLMWGSDCPYQLTPPHTYRASIAVIRDRLTNVTAGDREWLLRKAAERVFFA